MGSIEVDPAGLLRHAETLDAVAADLRFAPQRLDGLRTGDIGASNVTRALHRFADEWEYGLIPLAFVSKAWSRLPDALWLQ